MRVKGPRRGSGPRLRAGEAIAAASALVLLVVMFLPWYDLEYTSNLLNLLVVDVGRSGWQTLGGVAFFVALAIAAALGVAGLRLAGSAWKPIIAPGAAVAVLGGLATLLILFRILAPPGLGLEDLSFDVTPGLPAFIGLAAAFGIAFGGYRAMHAEGTSFAGVADKLKGDPRQREGGRGEGKDAGRTTKRAH
ncbi:MAG TPA: hypothetical protein VHR18_13030 [Solirubrobacterales bacterium]|jgi:hypothetical protein|nr:hypothetical protein [Solirubrobacterales bacterium]